MSFLCHRMSFALSFAFAQSTLNTCSGSRSSCLARLLSRKRLHKRHVFGCYGYIFCSCTTYQPAAMLSLSGPFAQLAPTPLLCVGSDGSQDRIIVQASSYICPMSALTESVAAKLKQKRIQLGVTQQELGLILGCSTNLIQHYEHGSCQMPYSTLSDFAFLCHEPIDWFFLAENELLVYVIPL
jgi:DNA-binding XRE family transcriptional regulator